MTTLLLRAEQPVPTRGFVRVGPTRADWSPLKSLAAKFDEPIAKVRGWVFQARERQFLVRLMANGMPGPQVAELTGYTPVHVSRIRARCCAERTAAVHERACSGRPRTITARKIAQVVALTLAPPPRGLSR